MHEAQLHQVLREHPELIENNLKFVEQEVLIGHGLRCDLLFVDKNNKKLYVEVKWKAGRRAAVQIEQYEVVKNENDARYMLVALESKPGIPEILIRRGFEFKIINRDLLLVIKPEWENIIKPKNQNATTIKSFNSDFPSKISGGAHMKKVFLNDLCKKLKEEFPEAIFKEYKDNNNIRYGIFIPWNEKDCFLIDFTSKVKDGLRCGFIVDFMDKYSEKRSNLQRIIKEANSNQEFEKILGYKVYENVDDNNIAKEGIEKWCKISAHRRMGIYSIFRISSFEHDWTDTNNSTDKFMPFIYNYIKKMSLILNRYYL